MQKLYGFVCDYCRKFFDVLEYTRQGKKRQLHYCSQGCLDKAMPKKRFTGKCICRHSFEDHHHGCIMNSQAMIDSGQEFRNVDGILAQECEATQFEGMFTPDVTWITWDKNGKPHKHHKHYKEMCHCNVYWDKGWGEPPKYRRE